MKNKIRFQRSDIPYKDRLLMEKYATVAEHRDDAASTALKVACVALNDVYGFGYERSLRFAVRVRELLNDYYDDPELESAHLVQRLQSIGFHVTDDGHMADLAKEAHGNG